jgi:hypothetical protein
VIHHASKDYAFRNLRLEKKVESDKLEGGKLAQIFKKEIPDFYEIFWSDYIELTHSFFSIKPF